MKRTRPARSWRGTEQREAIDSLVNAADTAGGEEGRLTFLIIIEHVVIGVVSVLWLRACGKHFD